MTKTVGTSEVYITDDKKVFRDIVMENLIRKWTHLTGKFDIEHQHWDLVIIEPSGLKKKKAFFRHQAEKSKLLTKGKIQVDVSLLQKH